MEFIMTKNDAAKWLEQFLLQKENDGAAPATLVEYGRSIGYFLESSGGEISRPALRVWTSQLKDKGNSDNTVAKHLRAVRVFINFLADEKIMEPIKVSIPKIREEEEKQAFAEQQIQMIDDWLRKTYPTGFGLGKGTVVDVNVQAHLRFWLPLETGMRITECLAATWDQIDWHQETMFVPAQKTVFNRHVALSTLWGRLIVLLRAARKEEGTILQTNFTRTYTMRNKETGRKEQMISDKGDPLTYQGHRTFIKKLSRGVGFKVRPHDLRRTLITQALEKIEIPVVADQAGHRNWSTTQRYFKGKLAERVNIFKKVREENKD